MTMEDTQAEVALSLDLKGVAASTGSACNAVIKLR